MTVMHTFWCILPFGQYLGVIFEAAVTLSVCHCFARQLWRMFF